jgi:hypothetical protein
MRFWVSVSLLLIMCVAANCRGRSSYSFAQARKKRANELSLAGLRPARDEVNRAFVLYKKPDLRSENGEHQQRWSDICYKTILSVDGDASHKIQIVRVSEADWLIGDCVPTIPPSPWVTGRGLRVWDSSRHVIKLYGEPDSRSPSTKGGQQLELLYYAFDWAGPDVPQVMEVLCTPEKDGKPGRVVEITLAGPSL